MELDARLRLRGRTRHGDKTRDRDLRLPFCGCAHTHWYSLGAARRLARACGFVRKGFLQVYDREVACTHRHYIASHVGLRLGIEQQASVFIDPAGLGLPSLRC